MDFLEEEKRLWIFKRISLVLLILSTGISYISENKFSWTISIYLLFFINTVCLIDSLCCKRKERYIFEGVMQLIIIFIIYKLITYDII